jgi:quercetin dioxygenase-like cupin family protein
MEVELLLLRRGDELPGHTHEEEETVYVEEGRLQIALGEGETFETYLVETGQASFHPPRVAHRITAVEDTRAVSFKNLVRPD